MPVDPEDLYTRDGKRRLQDSSSALEAASSTASAQQAVLGQTPGGGGRSGQVNDDQQKKSKRREEDSDSDSDVGDLNVCDPQGDGSQPTGGGSGGGTGCEGQDSDNDIDRGNGKLQALMAEADRIAGGWKRNRLSGGGLEASDAEDDNGEGVDVERKDFGKRCPVSALFGGGGGGGKSFRGEEDDNCSESGAKSDSDNSMGGAGVSRNMIQSQQRIVYVARMPRRGLPYEHWSQKNLRLACRNRGIRSMSKCKDNRIMAKHLVELDKWEKRESPYLGDFRLERDGQSCMAIRSNEITLSPSRGSSRYGAIPEDVKFKVQDAVEMGATFPSDRLLHYRGCSYRIGDVLTAIRAQRDRVQCNGGASPLYQTGEGGGTAEESGGTHGEKGTMARGPAAQPRGIVGVGEGKATARTASQHSDGVRKGWGSSRENPAHTAEDPDEGGRLGECPGSTNMAKNCAPRLVTLVVDKNRDSLATLSEAKSSRESLHAGAAGAHSKRWEKFGQDLAVDPEVGDRLPGGIRIIDIDPSEGEEIDILKAENQRAILKKIVSKSNNNVKTSSRSTDTEAPLEKCQENDQDTRYVVLAIEKPSNLLENRKGVEENGIEGECDAQRRREVFNQGRDWEESRGSVRKRARPEKAAEGRAKVGVQDTCSIVGREISKPLAPSTRSSTEGVEPSHSGAGAMAKFDEEIRRAEAECSRLKLDRARRDDRNDLFQVYTENYKELEKAKASGKDPFAVKYLEFVVASTKRKLMSLMEVES